MEGVGQEGEKMKEGTGTERDRYKQGTSSEEGVRRRSKGREMGWCRLTRDLDAVDWGLAHVWKGKELGALWIQFMLFGT